MWRCLALLVLTTLAVLLTACGCPRCAIDSQDGIGVALITRLSSAEKGAVASVLQLLTAHGGPEDPSVRALDAALSRGELYAGDFHAPPNSKIRGYVLMKDGMLVLDERFLRAAPLDSEYVGDARTWPFIPVLVAAGHRLSRGGSWTESVEAARKWAGEIAESLDSGGLRATLPKHTDPVSLARALRSWQKNF